MTYQFIQDAYQARRGGSSRVLDVCCEGCAKHVTFYQKDGPGSLRRMYVDRFIDMTPAGDELCCPHCQRVIGILITYAKENRLAYRLFVDAVTKRIVPRRQVG